MSRYRVSMDIGGTFTDFVVSDGEAGRALTGKVLTTPRDPSEGVIRGLTGLVEDFSDIEFVIHGTTVGINAFLERRGTRTLLVTTDGFHGAYTIGRNDRKELFSLQYRKPTPLVPPVDIHTVRERLLWDGTVKEPLVEADFAPIIDKIRSEDIEAVAICFLHSYVNPVHERQARDILTAAAPGLSVSLSSDVASEWREYERASSAVLNAYIAPIVERYLGHLISEVGDRGLRPTLHVMQSNGGAMTAQAARELPIQTLLSGPVGGSIGGQALSGLLSRPNLLCVDMGGTSFDASLIVNGSPSESTETDLEGLPVMMSLVDIHTVGAGGGSLAFVEAGALRVGPHSAGADPGPACYGRGGTEPTVTDANLFLGRLSPDYFLAGTMSLDIDAAQRAIRGVADQLGLDDVVFAEGVLAIINARMADAMRTITVEQGIDPREHSLVAFGGAGPMHAVALAEELGIREVVVPWAPGTFSAWGMLQADVRHDFTQTCYQPVDATDAEDIERVFAELEEQGRQTLASEDVPAERMHFERSADMRYVGQEYSVNVAVPDAVTEGLADVTERFHSAYDTRYGHSTPGAPAEFVTLRVAAIGALPHGEVGSAPTDGDPTEDSRARDVVFDGDPRRTTVLRRDRLTVGAAFDGPLVIEEDTATTVVPPDWRVVVDERGYLVVTTMQEATR